jgi:hypothetical protein
MSRIVSTVAIAVAAFVVRPAVALSQSGATQTAAGLDSSRRTMTAERMRPEERIVLDGVLDEPVWQRAQPATDFIQQEPILAPGGARGERVG